MNDFQATLEKTVNGILRETAKLRRFEIGLAILKAYEPKVLTGPFAGMRLVTETAWGDGDLAPKLLGCYEAELHPAIEKGIARRPRRVVNVGCADGYYAVGLARRLGEAQVHAFDIAEDAQTVCAAAAAANGVAERVAVGGLCTGETLRALHQDGARSLVVVDCEGGEATLFDPATVAALGRSDVIIECHDFKQRGLTPALRAAFAPTHEVEVIHEGARDPNQYTALHTLSSLDRWLAVCEFRPETMNWLACWAR